MDPILQLLAYSTKNEVSRGTQCNTNIQLIAKRYEKNNSFDAPRILVLVGLSLS